VGVSVRSHRLGKVVYAPVVTKLCGLESEGGIAGPCHPGSGISAEIKRSRAESGGSVLNLTTIQA
jgi:hypothetical protein